MNNGLIWAAILIIIGVLTLHGSTIYDLQEKEKQNVELQQNLSTDLIVLKDVLSKKGIEININRGGTK